jgi:ADP-heptose:LPS heptosyltransferase
LITDTSINSEAVERYINQLKNKDKVFNFSKYSKTLDYSIAMASLAKCIISPDTSLAHIGISVGTPVVGIYGPFPGKIRLSTYPKDQVRWVEPTADSCKYMPCFKHGKMCQVSKRLNLNYAPCFNGIDTDLVIQYVKEIEKKND